LFETAANEGSQSAEVKNPLDAIVLPERASLALGRGRKKVAPSPAPVPPALNETQFIPEENPLEIAAPAPITAEPAQEAAMPVVQAEDGQNQGERKKRRTPRLQKLDPSKLILEEIEDEPVAPVVPQQARVPQERKQRPNDPSNRNDKRPPVSPQGDPLEPTPPQDAPRAPRLPNQQQGPRSGQGAPRLPNQQQGQQAPRTTQGAPRIPVSQPAAGATPQIRQEPWSQYNIPESTEMDLTKRVAELTPQIGSLFFAEGVLEIQPERFGLVRSLNYYYQPSLDDFYVAPALINRYKLRQGDTVVGICRAPKVGERYFGMVKIEGINGMVPTLNDFRKNFEDLLPIYPDHRIKLEHARQEMVTRMIDLFAPIGRGQRGMIVAQPKTGKTTILRRIANAVSINHPEMKTLILLVDERPEEVTEMERTAPKAEVIASTFDMKPEMHVALAELVFEKAKRLVEAGHHVLVLLDSLTRLARAYNVCAGNGGRTMTGGIDAQALKKPRQLFSSARNIEGGGSLTIIATALVDTGSRMDDVIFEEFKGTGNNEIVLDRRLANNRIFPAIDIFRSGTRREDLFVKEEEREKVALLRRFVAAMSPVEAVEFLLDKMKGTRDNMDFLLSMNREAR
jgi:transcription termination factor Rho